ncbi:hypothetical protein AB0383_17135 [Amycolatopsis sp. NPDC051373]|uniref:hypothetical protein n=1 Tax=Amycolatopsis sp. NPDC051373 TaxID=3155801 RepID=UPI00344BE26C
MEEMLSGDDLAPYRVPPLGSCWWCGNDGPLTHEHKFKKADLKRMWGDGPAPVWGDSTRMRPIKSAQRSKDVRFTPGLCAPCNNARSQPFDRAYDVFSGFLWHRPSVYNGDVLDLSDVYGENWSTQTRLLVGYLAKHIASRMAHDGYQIPASLPAFLNGADRIGDVEIVLFKSREIHQRESELDRNGIDGRSLQLLPAVGRASRSRRQLEMYCSGLTISSVGVMYRWNLGATEANSFHHQRQPPLHWYHDLA